MRIIRAQSARLGHECIWRLKCYRQTEYLFRVWFRKIHSYPDFRRFPGRQIEYMHLGCGTCEGRSLGRTCFFVQGHIIGRHVKNSAGTVFTGTIPDQKIKTDIITINCYIRSVQGVYPGRLIITIAVFDYYRIVQPIHIPDLPGFAILFVINNDRILIFIRPSFQTGRQYPVCHVNGFLLMFMS